MHSELEDSFEVLWLHALEACHGAVSATEFDTPFAALLDFCDHDPTRLDQKLASELNKHSTIPIELFQYALFRVHLPTLVSKLQEQLADPKNQFAYRRYLERIEDALNPEWDSVDLFPSLVTYSRKIRRDEI
jgi:hypothetical protein